MQRWVRSTEQRRTAASLRMAAGIAFCVGVAAGRPPVVHAQAGQELTVEQSVRLGLERNARLRSAISEAAAAKAAERSVRAGRLPAIRGQASYTRLSSNIPGVEFMLPGIDSTFTFQAVQLDRYQAELSVSQPLLGQFRLRHEVRGAEHEAAAAALEAEQEQVDVAFEIRRAYWNLYRALAVRATLDAALAHVDEHLSEVRTRLAAGAALARDVLAAQTRRSEVLLERVEGENAVRLSQLELNRLIGMPLETEVRPAPDPDSVAAEAPPLPPAGGVEARPEVGALNEQVLGLEAQLRAVMAARLPELDITGRYLYARPNPYFFQEQDRFRGTWELGLSARWDIWEGGRQSARTGEARARLDAALARLADTRERAAVDLARQQLEVRRAAEAVSVAGQNVLEAEETFKVVRQQFGEGTALSADVLDAEQAYRRAQARRSGALADHAIARAAVLNALGRVW